MEQLPLPPTTTLAEDKTTEGQRTINLIWENTQSKIALFTVVVGILVNALVVLFLLAINREASINQLAIITICLQFINLTTGIVIGFYFSRTNHQAIGGTGIKATDEQEYVGR